MAAVKIDGLSEAERDAVISSLMNEEAKLFCDSLVKGSLFCHLFLVVSDPKS